VRLTDDDAYKALLNESGAIGENWPNLSARRDPLDDWIQRIKEHKSGREVSQILDTRA